MKYFLNIALLFGLLLMVLSGCQKLEDLEHCGPESPATELRRGPENDVYTNPTPPQGRHDDVVPVDDGDNVNDDDDNEDGDEIQGAAKRN